ncbi:MAG: family 20 glycosylhydrolase [Saprospiraceae bacterium]
MKNSTNIIFSILFLAILMMTSCETEPITPPLQGVADIIPAPSNLIKKEGHFLLDENVQITLPNDKEEWKLVAQNLNEKIYNSTSKRLPTTTNNKIEKDVIRIIQSDDISQKEGYQLNINAYEIELKAKTPNGAFLGVQTLLQLMPVEVFSKNKTTNLRFNIPQVEINDSPRFSYRGMHLDVARHFFSVDDVKRYIDLMGIHKYNTFHWHLTEDQGWRIEIKKYPKLTEVGGFRKETLVGHYNDQPHQFDGKRYGGFYTQEQIKEVVKYASERFITVIPEIELPGHAQAAIAAYPELGCSDMPLEVMTKWGVSNNVFCPKEETFTFLKNVLTEVVELFPSQYIHIGGDECPKTQWKESQFCQTLMKENRLQDEMELQSYFIGRIEQFLNSKGKKIIGWDEILEGGLAPNASVMSWRGVQGGIDAATQGHDVIMSPTSHCYFDYYQSQHKDEPLAIGGYLPIEKVYSYQPIPEEITADKVHHIKGVQANLWTEYIPSSEKLDYMAFPRACALAEVAWTEKSKRNFPDFVERLNTHLQRLTVYGVNTAMNVFDIDGDLTSQDGKLMATLKSNVANTTIAYTLDGSTPTLQSNIYNNTFPINASSQLRAVGFINKEQKGRSFEKDINFHKATGKTISLKKQPAPHFAAGGTAAVINGIKGSDERYGDKEWLGFEGKNMEAVIDMKEETEINKISFRFFKGEGQWIYLPKKVSVFVSNDGNKYTLAGETTSIATKTKVATPTVEVNSKATFVKVLVERFGKIPEGMQGGGHEAWLFVDEIIVE